MWRPGQKIEALMIQFAPSAPQGPRPTDLTFGYEIFAIELSNERRHLLVTYVTSKETRRLPHDRSTEGARFRCSRVHWPVCTSLAYHSFETTNLYHLSVTSASHHCTARLRSKNERELSMRKSICESAGSI